MIKIENVRKITLNGKPCKSFEVWQRTMSGDAWVFAGAFTAKPNATIAQLAELAWERLESKETMWDYMV